jgi:enoyl-CoA hydratase/carnithine racemase
MELEPLRLTVPEAIDAVSARALTEALLAAGRQGGAAIVLSGREGLFCRGMDFDRVLAATGSDDQAALSVSQRSTLGEGVAAFAALLQTIVECPRPVVAMIDGAVLGGGVGIAAACDVVLATRRSTFGLPEALFGLIPAVVLPVLCLRLSPQRARLLAMTAYSRSAEEASALGLVDVVCAEDKQAAALRRSLRDLGRAQHGAIAALKRFSSEIESRPFAEGLAQGVRETTARLGQPEILAAVREFLSEGGAPWA